MEPSSTCTKPRFLSTLSLRRATIPKNGLGPVGAISIHALLAESDSIPRAKSARPTNFYPRSPCGERLSAFMQIPGHWHFYPRSPCGERRYLCMYVHNLAHISIHALLAESDSFCTCVARHSRRFLSTLSLRRATITDTVEKMIGKISIHALLAESDHTGVSTTFPA